MSAAPPPIPHQPSPGPVRPEPGGSLVRAVCGPLILTALGVLLTLDHLGHVSFGRTWPALLIIFGTCKLAEYLGERRV